MKSTAIIIRGTRSFYPHLDHYTGFRNTQLCPHSRITF